MIRLLLFALILCALITAGCARNEAATTSVASSPKATVVSVVRAISRTVPASFEETGTFNPDETSDIAPLVAGRVMATPVNVGDFVKRGQVICELDHRDAQLRLDQARAQLEESTASLRQAQSRIGWDGKASFDAANLPEVIAARANYQSAQAQAKMAAADSKRFENLVATGDVSRSAFEKARTAQETAEAQANAARQQYEAALNAARMSFAAVETSQASLSAMRAQVAQAEKGLTDTTITAPYDGYITARIVAAGVYVGLNNKIATIVRIGLLKLQLQTPEQRTAQLKVGMPVVARVSAYPGRDFTGKVTALNPSVDPGSRIFILEARFDNPHVELRPGMFATARILLPGGEDAVFVPQSAVVRDKTTDSYQVFAVENKTARLRVVTIGDAAEGLVRIQSGLRGGETVATNHQAELYDGASVEPRS